MDLSKEFWKNTDVSQEFQGKFWESSRKTDGSAQTDSNKLQQSQDMFREVSKRFHRMQEYSQEISAIFLVRVHFALYVHIKAAITCLVVKLVPASLPTLFKTSWASKKTRKPKHQIFRNLSKIFNDYFHLGVFFHDIFLEGFFSYKPPGVFWTYQGPRMQWFV